MNALTQKKNNLTPYHFSLKNNQQTIGLCIKVQNKKELISQYNELTYELVFGSIERLAKIKLLVSNSLHVFNDFIEIDEVFFIQTQVLGSTEEAVQFIDEMEKIIAKILSIELKLVKLAFSITHSNNNINYFSALDLANTLNNSHKSTSLVPISNEVTHSQLFNEFIHARDTDLINLHGQPIINSTTKTMHSIELLLRYSGKNKRWTNPELFIKDATKEGFLEELTTHIIQRAARFIKRLHKDGFDVPAAVNLSSKQMQIPNCFAMIKKTLNDFKIHPSRLIIELTEEHPLPPNSTATEFLDQCVDFGITLALDDIGIGIEFNDIKNLYTGRFKTAKLDKTFANANKNSKHNATVINEILPIINSMGCTLVFEGIEDLSHTFPIGENFKYQGFAYAKPQSIEQLISFISSKNYK